MMLCRGIYSHALCRVGLIARHLRIRDIGQYSRGGGWDFSREGLENVHGVGKGHRRGEVIISKQGVIKEEDSSGGKS